MNCRRDVRKLKMKLSDFGCLNGMQKGPMDILAQTVRKEGVIALWKGTLFLFPCLSTL